ncbi:hypothetical protein M3Y97_00905400 [Aphelenchoides bicaudatus]|nr:hypothetical protein M3Y97_00905400 [Aphelenchoides bicaudatus]
MFSDSMEKRRAKKNDAMLAEKNKRNYGSCTDKLLATCEAPNGKVKSTSIKSRASGNSSSKDRRTSSADRRSTTHSSKRSNNNNEDLTSITIDTNRQDLSQPETSPASCATDSRSFQRMFACDLSQLPAEDDLIDEQDPDAVFLDEPFEAQISPKQQSYIENAEIHSHSVDNTPNVSNNRRPQPIVPIVNIASGSQFSIDKDVDKEADKPEDVAGKIWISNGINKYFQQTKSPLLSAISEMPFDRPLSRRGSRDSTPEKGHEEFDDDVSVDSLQPWGDKPSESPQQRRQMPNPEITFDQSSSESEDETNEVYHKLKEDDDQRDLKTEEELDKTDETKELNGENEPSKEKSEHVEQRDECSGSDEELLNENRMLERHSYQRLEESPLPSPSIYTNNNSVDNKLLKTKSSEDAVNNLNEEIDEEDLR